MIDDLEPGSAASRAGDEFARRATEVAPGILYVYDLVEHRNVWGNREMTAALGYGREAIERMGSALLPTLMHPDDLVRYVAHAARLETLADGEVAEFDYRMRHADGSWRWLASREMAFTRDAAGNVRQIVGSALDVTERRQVEDALADTASSLARERERLALALHAGGLGVYEWRVGTDAVWWSPEMYGVYGADPTFVPTLEAFVGLIHPDDRDELWRRTEECIATGSVFRHEYRIVRPDGAVRWVFNHSRVATDADGGGARLVGVAADVTERRHASAALEAARARAEAASAAKSEFLTVMSHELRTPLNAIQGHVQLLEMEIHGPLTGAQRDALARVQRSQAHLLRLVNDVLNLSRIEAGHVDYAIEDVDLAEVLDEVAPVVGEQLATRGIAWTVEVAAGTRVRADRAKLEQVLVNLLANAAKFTPPGGRVTVRCGGRPDAPPGVVYLQVADTGCGIPAAKLEAIFEPFVQVDAGRTRTTEGVGLGLAISRDLVRGMGGELRARSVVGSGSTFTVTLPRAGAPAAPTRPPAT